MSEAAWRRRFRAPVVMFPTWARDNPERLLYLSNAGGKFEVYAALGKPSEEYRYDAGHGSLVVDERIKQVAMEIAFVAKHLGTTPSRA